MTLHRKIVLHIGAPKCGSTYIQNLMKKNQATLNCNGVFYPDPPSSHPGNGLLISTQSESHFDSWFTDEIHTVFLSHEDLFSAPKYGQRLILWAKERRIPVIGIAFLRPFSEFIFGDFSQHMKQNFEHYLRQRNPYDGLNFEAFVKQRTKTLTPAKFLRSWQGLLGSNLHLGSHREIKTVLDKQLPSQAIADWELPRDQTNRSISMASCDELSQMMKEPNTANELIRQRYKAALFPSNKPDSGRTKTRTEFIENAFWKETDALVEDFNYPM